MKHTPALLALLVVTLSACKKEQLSTPSAPYEFIQGDWELESVRGKSNKGKYRIGGSKLKVELTMHVDSLRFETINEFDEVTSTGEYQVVGDSLFVFDEMTASDKPTTFLIQRGNANELRLAETGDTNTRLFGDVDFEHVYRFKRM